MKYSIVTILLLFVLVLANIFSVNNYLIGIDLGTEYFKVSMLKPGKPFTMVENLQSKTKTPTSIAFKDDERVFGADAIVKKPRFPKQVLTYFHQYLAKKYNSDEVKNFLEKFFISYEMEEDENRHTIKIKVNFNKEEFNFSIEEIFGMIFRYIKFLSDKFSNGDIKDCVVTVPNFFGYKERLALAQAVELSKLNLISMVSENVAAAIQFSQNKHFNNTEYFIFYNMGSSYVQATLVSYLSHLQEKNNKTVEMFKTITVLGESYDKNLGGNLLNFNLVRNLMKKFDELPERKGKNSIMKDYRVAERILPSAIKYKEILSANKEVPVSVLGVDSGMNLVGKLMREEFELINANDIDKSYDPIEKLLNKTGLSLGNISQIELIGGSVRIPKVQEVLKHKLGEYSNILGQHMNGDDSMALGASYICANHSTNFKGSKIQLYHGNNFELRLKLINLNETESGNNTQFFCDENFTELADNCIRKLEKNTTIYKVRSGYDVAKTVSFNHDGDFKVSLFEKFEDSEDENLLIIYTIKGVQNALSSMKKENITTSPKIHLRFDQDSRGIISLKADLSYEIIQYFTMQTGTTGGIEFLYMPTYVDPLKEEELKKIDEEMKELNLTDPSRTLLNMKKDVGKKNIRKEKKDLQVDIEYTNPRPLTKEELEKSREKLDKLDDIDKNRIQTMEIRNSLEALIYGRKEWMESNMPKLYGKDSEIEAATLTLKEISDWYEEEGYSADFNALNSKYNDLLKKFKTFDSRILNHQKREKFIEKFESELKKIKENSLQLIKSKSWLENHYNTTFLKEINKVQEWYTEIKEKQAKIALNEDENVLLPEMIEHKINIMRREFSAMSRIPKPKLPQTQDNIKIEDLINNGTNLEDLIRRANLTANEQENSTKTNETQSQNEESHEKKSDL